MTVVKAFTAFGRIIILISAVSIAHADDDKGALPVVSFRRFPYPLVRTSVRSAAGKPTDKANLDPTDPDDFPPSVTTVFEDARPYQTPRNTYNFGFVGHNVLRVYRLSDVQKAPYETIQYDMKALQKLLKDRPLSVQNKDGTSADLPEYPFRNSAHAFQLHIHYIDATWGSGLCYMTLFTQDSSNHADNDALTYLFQGLSKDGAFYVSADFRITHPRLDHWRWKGAYGDYTADRKLLSSLKGNSFTPKLPQIDRWLMSLRLE